MRLKKHSLFLIKKVHHFYYQFHVNHQITCKHNINVRKTERNSYLKTLQEQNVRFFYSLEISAKGNMENNHPSFKANKWICIYNMCVCLKSFDWHIFLPLFYDMLLVLKICCCDIPRKPKGIIITVQFTCFFVF